jgi:hypothetical protein
MGGGRCFAARTAKPCLGWVWRCGRSGDVVTVEGRGVACLHAGVCGSATQGLNIRIVKVGTSTEAFVLQRRSGFQPR